MECAIESRDKSLKENNQSIAVINGLIAQIQDAELRNKMEQEVNRMNKQKKVGLVFEFHGGSVMSENLYHSIILNQDTKSLFSLSNSEKEDFLFVLLYHYLPAKSLNEMNEVQKTLFLASKLEDTCQADALPTLSEDKEIFLALPEMKKALERLGALKTAALLDEFISLVPVGTVPEWEWFFEGERKDIIDRIDGQICNYPDGLMCKLYVSYISNIQNAKQLLRDLV